MQQNPKQENLPSATEKFHKNNKLYNSKVIFI